MIAGFVVSRTESIMVNDIDNKNPMNTNDNLLKAQKQFIDSVHGGFTEDHFILAMSSGATGTVYAMTPKHMKRFSQWAAYQVAEFEKKHHEIETEWVPGTKSPIQFDGAPEEKGNEEDSK